MSRSYRTALGLLALLVLAAWGGDQAGTPSPIPEFSNDRSARDLAVTPGTLVVVADGVSWALPRTACLIAPGDGAATAALADESAARVRQVVAEHVSGWPTTTVAMPTSRAEFYVTVNRLGPLALALGAIAGTDATLTTGWHDFEAEYADPPSEWGAVQEISRRLVAWRATAATIVAGLPAACH